MFVVIEYCVEGKQFNPSTQGVRGVKLRAQKKSVTQLKTSAPEIYRAISNAVSQFFKNIKTTIIIIIHFLSSQYNEQFTGCCGFLVYSTSSLVK